MVYARDTLVEPEMLLPDNKACLRLPGIDGKAKMSKSLGTASIWARTRTRSKKVMSMFTEPLAWKTRSSRYLTPYSSI